jgi:hypothetical protein
MMRPAAWLLAAAVVGGACSPLVSFPNLDTESGALTCSDGEDNDLDGQTDCEDPGCDSVCNRCGEVAEPESDELGQVCSRDCECPVNQSCNERARVVVDGPRNGQRCAPTPEPPDEGFDIHFIVQSDTPAGGLQNVLGTVRFNGDDSPIESATWLPNDSLIDFRGPPEQGQQRVLLLRDFGTIALPRPADDLVEVRVADEIESTGEAGADFGLVPVGEGGEGLGLNAVGVVTTATLSFEPLAETPAGFWRGRFRGRLRNAVGYDRFGRCTDTDEVYDADLGDCRPVSLLSEALFFLACTYRSQAPRGRGGLSSAWRPWFDAQDYRLVEEGECAARVEGELVRIRSAVDGTSSFRPVQSHVLELRIPRFRVVSSVGLDVGDNVQALLWQTMVVEEDRVTPLLDLDLGMPDRELEGRLRIDEQRLGPDGRFLGWVRGTVRTPQ